MSDYNFIRFFVILNESKKGYGTIGAPSGYCKVESLNGNAVFTVSIRNLKPSDSPYKLYILLKNSDTPIYAGEIIPAQDGVVYKNYQTKADNVFQSSAEITALEAMHILSDDNSSVLCGYMNRNMTKQAQQYSDIKLKNIENENNTAAFEAASTNINDIEFDTSLPDEIESPASSLESIELSSEPDAAAESSSELSDENNSQDNNSDNTGAQPNQSGSLSSYVQTLAKLYEGIVGSSASSPKQEAAPAKEDTCEYWGKINNYYGELFDKEKNIFPFDFCKNNSKWILVSPYGNGNCAQLIGLVYENGGVKYIVNGAPVYANAFAAPYVTPHMLWLPAKPNGHAIIGYWLTFIDAATGKISEPSVGVL